MAGVPKVKTALASFLQSVQAAEDLLTGVSRLRSTARGGASALSDRQFEMVVELSFLQRYLAWEEFLEESFIRYLCGSSSPNGTKFPRLVKPRDRATVDRLLYVHRRPDWTTPGQVMSLAESMFESGGPFVPVGNASVDLTDMKAIRNGIAHRSLSAREQFEKVVRRVHGSVPRGITPGGYLLRRPPAKRSSASTFLAHYSDVLAGLARMIAP
jgi:hypothetical protein